MSEEEVQEVHRALKALPRLPRLEKLGLMHCCLSSVPRVVGAQSSLTHLDLSGNKGLSLL